MIVRHGRVLLLRRAREPRRGAWDLPGGYLEADEHPSAGAVREAREEAGLVVTTTAQFGVYLGTYGPADDPDYILNVVYLADAGDGAPAGDAWLRRFRSRLPPVDARRGRHLAGTRLRADDCDRPGQHPGDHPPGLGRRVDAAPER
ncbi:MAG: NUDIX hydrolase [Chloroflexi bacterium]|nr:NUDIX hydrolase [Chloroflexota bacterium]